LIIGGDLHTRFLQIAYLDKDSPLLVGGAEQNRPGGENRAVALRQPTHLFSGQALGRSGEYTG
jgi:hypothetical protein